MEQSEREAMEAIASYERAPDEPYGGGPVEMVICPVCGGSGDDPEDRKHECVTCKGEGQVPEDQAASL
jgi:hypothetical protein